MEFEEVIDCTNCPCLSRCHVERNCNLDYETDLRWTDKKHLIYSSKNCELQNVVFGNEIFERDTAKVTSIRPEHWQS